VPSQTDRLSAALAGRYRIERELGQGGMATVYLAEDLKHDRKVAIKVLKPELAAVLGAERFVVEIKTTAALSHPHILPLFDSGTADGFLFYVMPFIEGETIREKLNRETQFGVDEAVRIAREVADALDYAHRHGVIHRDIKPENILLHDGRAMVMDFGIALAVSAAAGGRMTETGLSLGTPHYMSPEQATADKDLTARSDVYSLASVLYEMLAGEPPHTGSSAQAVIMKIITDTARPVNDLRKNVPGNVVAALAKALEKLPADRFASAKSFADALSNASFATLAATTGARAAAPRRWYASPLPYAAGLVVAVAALVWQGTRKPGAVGMTGPVRFVVRPPAGGLGLVRFGSTAVSADGRRIAFMARTGSKLLLHVLEIGQLEARPVQGTEGAVYFAFSPDGSTIVFQSAVGGVRRVAVDGGAVTDVPVPAAVRKLLPSGISWTGHTILASLGISGITVIPDNGGAARTIQVLQNGKPCGCARRAILSADGKVILMAASETGTFAVPIEGGEVRDLGISAEAIAGLVDGVLVYLTADGTLMAAPFDLGRMKVGKAIPVESRVRAQSGPSLSVNGTLVMLSGVDEMQLHLVDERGVGKSIGVSALYYQYPRFSPDGQRVAVSQRQRTGATDVYVIDVASATSARLTSGYDADRPEWSPDGKQVLFRKYGPGREELWWKPFDNSGPAVLVHARPDAFVSEGMLSPDGKTLLYRTLARTQDTGRDIWYRGMTGDTTSKPFEVTPFDEAGPRFSPDGHWVVYVSNESGSPEVFVRPFPGPGGRVQVSSGGGSDPVWAPDGKRIFYMDGTDLIAANLTTGPAISVTSRTTLFSGDLASGGVHANYDVAKDGHHFLMVDSEGGPADLTVVVNWLADVKRRLRE
jgi:eukaryotic-like serine/threonine-protein kinase